jgi:pyruvate/2-oxoglutarate dehydrogenase complex dihydrolipoamide dehydrogenase (E3) component
MHSERRAEPDGYDFVVIGGGSAGTAAAAEAVKLGHERVLLVNDRELGGLCILAGCVPTKTLLHSAERLLDLHGAQRLGIDAPVVGVRLDALQERRRALVERFKGANGRSVANAGYEIAAGRACFESHDVVCITGVDGSERRVSARAFLVATGSRAVRPALPGLAGTPYWTSDEALSVEHVPATLAIVGGGAVALEFATFFAALGTRVTLLSRSPLLGGDERLASVLAKNLTDSGVCVETGAEVTNVAHDGERFEVEWFRGDGRENVRTERLLIATGRAPALEGLRLDVAGVEVEVVDGRPILDEHLCGTNGRVFFAGDASGEHLVLHLANEQGRHVARNLARHARETRLARWQERVPLQVVFTHPPYAACGVSAQAARAAGLDVVTASRDLSNLGRGIVMDVPPGGGYVELVAERPSSRLLGCTIVGPRADDLVHVVALALHMGASARDLLAAPWYHPTLSEVFLELAREIALACEQPLAAIHVG